MDKLLGHRVLLAGKIGRDKFNCPGGEQAIPVMDDDPFVLPLSILCMIFI